MAGSREVGLSMLLRLLACFTLLACGLGSALAQGNGRPTRPPGWEFRPAQGVNPPAFAYDPCPGCYDEDLSYLIVSCPGGDLAQVMVQPPDRANVLARLEGRTVDIILDIDGRRYALRGPLEGGPNGSTMTARLDPRVPLIGALAAARRLRMISPGNAGSEDLPTQGSGAAIRRWMQACGLAPAETRDAVMSR
jgi:hypothetical protein